MSTAIAACTCVTWEKDDASVRLCVEHHRYHRGAKRLASVSRVIRETWPLVADFTKADPAVLENARERGIAVDELFSAYVNGTLTKIPAGTRIDARDLFLKAKAWWDKSGQAGRSQVLLADDETAGTCDLIVGNVIIDLKTTYNIEATYPIQLGAYADLYEAQTGLACDGIAILHLTERFAAPRWIPLDLETSRNDWRTLRQMYRTVQRLTRKPDPVSA